MQRKMTQPEFANLLGTQAHFRCFATLPLNGNSVVPLETEEKHTYQSIQKLVVLSPSNACEDLWYSGP
jgi:hypothetical protein